MLAVFHHHEGHTGSDKTNHRSDGAHAMTGMQGDPASLDKGLRGLKVRGPALVLYSPEQGATHGTTHGFPRQRWPRVQYGVLPELRQHLMGRTQRHQIWPGRIDPLQRLL